MLSLPSTYSSNLGQHIQEDYLVKVFNEDGNYLALATSDQTIGSVNYVGAITNAPTIRESINIIDASAQLSNISISLANFSFSSNGTVSLGSSTPIEEELFFGTNYYINRNVEVYSQLNGDTNASNLLLIFKGRLRAVQLSENKVTLQISAQNPFKDIQIPQTISEAGLYKPIVFGDYSASSISNPLQDALGAYKLTYPVQVEKIDTGNIFCLTPNAGNQSNKTLHVHEQGLNREGAGPNSQLMANTTATETAISSADSNPIITKQIGSDDLFAVGTDLSLARTFKSQMLLTSTDYTISNKHTPVATASVSSTNTTGDVIVVTDEFDFVNFGTIQHTPSSMVFTCNFGYSLSLARNGGSSAGVITNVRLDAKISHNDDSTVDETINLINDSPNAVTASSSAARTINLHSSSNSEYTGNLPQKIHLEFKVTYDGLEPGEVGSGASNVLSGSSSIGSSFITATTSFERDNSSVQVDTELKNDIKELYSAQDGLSLDSNLIKKPIEAHRYLCETFVDSNVFPANVGTTNNYANILANHKLLGRIGDINYWLNKSTKLESVLKKLQQFGFFIGRMRASGSYHYISPMHLTTSTTTSTTEPYFATAGTAHSSNLLTSTTDTSMKITLAQTGQGYTNGDLLCIPFTTTVGGVDYQQYEFIKVTNSGPMQANSTTQTLTVQRAVAPITTFNAPSTSSGDTIYKVIFPNSVLDENDFSNLQISHTPVNELITKWQIKFKRRPEDNQQYGATGTFTNTATRSNYNIEDENVKEISNDIDQVGSLTTNYYNYYNHLIGEPRLRVSLDVVNPSFYGLEVGDILRIYTTSKAPFGKNWRSVYFIVTSTSRTLGKISLSAQELY